MEEHPHTAESEEVASASSSIGIISMRAEQGIDRLRHEQHDGGDAERAVSVT